MERPTSIGAQLIYVNWLTLKIWPRTIDSRQESLIKEQTERRRDWEVQIGSYEIVMAMWSSV